MTKFLLLCFCLYSFGFYSQQKFPVDLIPAHLKEKVDAVVRVDQTIFRIENIAKAYSNHHIVVTIFNEKGEEKYAKFYCWYSKLSKVVSLEGKLFDYSGKEIQSLKSSEIQDVSFSSKGYEIDDSRYKIATFNQKKYAFPYTVEFRSIVETNNMMFYPTWSPIHQEKVSVEKSSLTIVTPKDIAFRYKEINLEQPCIKTESDKQTTYFWQQENIKPIKKEKFSSTDIYPKVLTAPINFEIEGYKGAIRTWEDLSQFRASLNENRDELPENVKLKIKELTKNENSTRVKIQKLYEYLQANTRYVSIQQGIGGWQTMTALEVSKKGYGDCKALSNYMKAMLKEIGITSYLASISAGDDALNIYEDFPSTQTNHVITLIPLEKDTLWLECTTQNGSMGYQGSFTGNRKALIFKPQGGALVNTTFYKSSDNLQLRNAQVKIDQDGNAHAIVNTKYTGIQQERRNALIHYNSNEEQKKWFLENIHIPNFELSNFALAEKKGIIPVVEEKLELVINKLLSQSGSRLFITPHLMTTFIDVPLDEETRKSDLFLNPNIYNFQDIDTVSYELPANYVSEHIPEAINLTSKFGEYHQKISIVNGKLLYCRQVIIKSGTFPTTDYTEWVKFIKKVNKSDGNSVVFIKK